MTREVTISMSELITLECVFIPTIFVIVFIIVIFVHCLDTFSQ